MNVSATPARHYRSLPITTEHTECTECTETKH